MMQFHMVGLVCTITKIIGAYVSRKFIKKLNKNKKYHVIIKTEVLKNNMNVLEYKIKENRIRLF